MARLQTASEIDALKLKPQALSVDTFVQPEANLSQGGAGQLGEALGLAVKIGQAYGAQKEVEDKEFAVGQAAEYARKYNVSMTEWDEVVKKEGLSYGDNPHVKEEWMILRGNEYSRGWRGHWLDFYASSDIKNSDDPNEFDKVYAEQQKEYWKDIDTTNYPPMARMMMANADAQTAQEMGQAHQKYRVGQTEAGIIEAGSNEMSAIAEENWTAPGGYDPERTARNITATIKDMTDHGVPFAVANAAAVQAVLATAERLEAGDLAEVLELIDPSGSGDLGSTTSGAANLTATQLRIERAQDREDSRQRQAGIDEAVDRIHEAETEGGLLLVEDPHADTTLIEERLIAEKGGRAALAGFLALKRSMQKDLESGGKTGLGQSEYLTFRREFRDQYTIGPAEGQAYLTTRGDDLSATQIGYAIAEAADAKLNSPWYTQPWQKTSIGYGLDRIKAIGATPGLPGIDDETTLRMQDYETMIKDRTQVYRDNGGSTDPTSPTFRVAWEQINREVLRDLDVPMRATEEEKKELQKAKLENEEDPTTALSDEEAEVADEAAELAAQGLHRVDVNGRMGPRSVIREIDPGRSLGQRFVDRLTTPSLTPTTGPRGGAKRTPAPESDPVTQVVEAISNAVQPEEEAPAEVQEVGLTVAQERNGGTPGPGRRKPVPTDAQVASTERTAAERTADVESGSDGDASQSETSSAGGKYGFTNGTFVEQARLHAPERVKGMTDEEIIALKKDPKESKLHLAVFKGYRAGNAAELVKYDLDVNDANLYMLHFGGRTGGRRVLQATDDKLVSDVLSKDAMKANEFMQGWTIGQLKAWTRKKWPN